MQAIETRFGSGATAPHEIEWLTDNGSCYTAQQTYPSENLRLAKPDRAV
jgi:hypothetical protein